MSSEINLNQKHEVLKEKKSKDECNESFRLYSKQEILKAQKLVDEYNASGREDDHVTLRVNHNTTILIPKEMAKDRTFIESKMRKYARITKTTKAL